jgi:hypothetical protein
MQWYSVRCIFRWFHDDSQVYEERITLWQADDFDHAIALAEADAAEYATAVDAEFLGFSQCYELFDAVGNGAEVYSLVRGSELPPADYLTAFFDTGKERSMTSD